MLSAILLSGKRPQELLLLKTLCEQGSIPVQTFADSLAAQGLDHSEACLNTIERVLNLQWFTESQRLSFGDLPLVVREGSVFKLSDDFRMLYRSYADTEHFSAVSFRDHVDDLIETGLLLNRKNFNGSDQFIQGKRYSRRDVCRLLNLSLIHI